jgi:preprotein translocase subunit SecG
MAFAFSFIQLVLSALLVVLVLMHSGKDAGLSGMFTPGQSSFGGTAVMERNLNRITVLVAILFAVNGIVLGFLL